MQIVLESKQILFYKNGKKLKYIMHQAIALSYKNVDGVSKWQNRFENLSKPIVLYW